MLTKYYKNISTFFWYQPRDSQVSPAPKHSYNSDLQKKKHFQIKELGHRNQYAGINGKGFFNYDTHQQI
jgi:hypothetical protein